MVSFDTSIAGRGASCGDEDAGAEGGASGREDGGDSAVKKRKKNDPSVIEGRSLFPDMGILVLACHIEPAL